MKRKVIRDKDGNIINIGPWNYRRALVPVIADGTEKVPARIANQGELLGTRKHIGEDAIEKTINIYAKGGEQIKERRAFEGEMLGQAAVGEAQNPLPQGAYESEADIVSGYDGGLYEASDPRVHGPQN